MLDSYTVGLERLLQVISVKVSNYKCICPAEARTNVYYTNPTSSPQSTWSICIAHTELYGITITPLQSSEDTNLESGRALYDGSLFKIQLGLRNRLEYNQLNKWAEGRDESTNTSENAVNNTIFGILPKFHGWDQFVVVATQNRPSNLIWINYSKPMDHFPNLITDRVSGITRTNCWNTIRFTNDDVNHGSTWSGILC